MKNHYLIPIVCFLCSFSIALAQNQSSVYRLRGFLTDAVTNEPIEDVNLSVSNSKNATRTDKNGYFEIVYYALPVSLTCSHVEFKTKVVDFTIDPDTNMSIRLEQNFMQLEEVSVSTGYQIISKERSTGSFDFLEGEVIDRQVGSFLLDRLDGNVNATLFDKRSATPQITVRGRSTIHAESQPLIVLDNFPYEGDISNINPNDIESISILKDAAAASIWGARAGNGVIVITTKKGKAGQSMQIGFNANTTVGEKPDVFYQPTITSTDFIDMEIDLFHKGFYSALETSYDNIALSPVIELLIQERDGEISPASARNQINAFRNNDIRRDYKKYLYRNSVLQQYAANISGGSEKTTHFFSVGYDQNRESLNEKYRRINLRTENTFNVSKNIAFNLGLFYTSAVSNEGRPAHNNLRFTSNQPLYPYARLADEDGVPLAISKNYRNSFVREAENAGLLDWSYTPLRDMEMIDNRYTNRDLLLNSGLHLKLIKGLNADIKYQYQHIVSEGRNLQHQALYSVRDMINNYTQTDPVSATFTRPIPLGDILATSNGTGATHAFRAQLNYDFLKGKNEVNAIAGAEYRSVVRQSSSSGVYGFNDDILVHTPVNHEEVYPMYANPFLTARIGDMRTFDGNVSRIRSFYTNMAYTYNHRYVLSFSARQDGSNVFGVNANQRVVPLWSLGGAWNLSTEDFYNFKPIPFLKFRFTYGYSGNIDQSLSAYTTMRYYTTNLNNQPYGMIMNPPNPELRWERVRMLNTGIDFAGLNRRIAGSIEYYHKTSIDLIGDMPIDQTTGAISGQLIFANRGNSANMKGEGIDINLHIKNKIGIVNWNTAVLFNFNRSRVTDYLRESLPISQYVNGGYGIVPIIGKPLNSVFTYAWAGLDPQTGDPMGYLNGEISKDYIGILNLSEEEDLIYHGQALPSHFGAVRNTLEWKGLSLSANITYRFGYYFLRNSINYQSLYNTWVGHADYGKRWQNPGDERHTQVPSAIYPINSNRDAFYTQSGTLVEKGDHIRLQDINLSYRLDKLSAAKLPFSNVTIYTYINNVGILWRANKQNIDPDFGTALPAVRTYAVGIRANL